MKIIILFLLLISHLSFAGNGKGNGQLIYKNEKGAWVPFEYTFIERVKIFRGYSDLPSKEKAYGQDVFNKYYKDYNSFWLKQVSKTLSLVHASLISRAEELDYFFVNAELAIVPKDYNLSWVKEDKKVAAVYRDNKVYISIPNMNLIGTAHGLKKEINQGFVLFHELVNATFQYEEEEESRHLFNSLILESVVREVKQEEFYTEFLHRFSNNIDLFLRDKNIDFRVKFKAISNFDERNSAYQSYNLNCMRVIDSFIENNYEFNPLSYSFKRYGFDKIPCEFYTKDRENRFIQEHGISTELESRIRKSLINIEIKAIKDELKTKPFSYLWNNLYEFVKDEKVYLSNLLSRYIQNYLNSYIGKRKVLGSILINEILSRLQENELDMSNKLIIHSKHASSINETILTIDENFENEFKSEISLGSFVKTVEQKYISPFLFSKYSEVLNKIISQKPRKVSEISNSALGSMFSIFEKEQLDFFNEDQLAKLNSLVDTMTKTIDSNEVIGYVLYHTSLGSNKEVNDPYIKDYILEKLNITYSKNLYKKLINLTNIRTDGYTDYYLDPTLLNYTNLNISYDGKPTQFKITSFYIDSGRIQIKCKRKVHLFKNDTYSYNSTLLSFTKRLQTGEIKLYEE